MKGARAACLGVLAAVLVTASVVAPVGAAGEATLRVEPAVVKAAEGGEFAVRVVSDSPIPLSGAQASLEFDPSILAVESVSVDGPYAPADFVLPEDLGAVAGAANTSGRLAQVAAAFIPPKGVPAGGAPFVVVRFRVIGCGETALSLPVGPRDAQLIDARPDTYGYDVPVTTEGGRVVTCVPAAEVTPTELETVAGQGGVPAGALASVAAVALGVLAALAVGLRRRTARPAPPSPPEPTVPSVP